MFRSRPSPFWTFVSFLAFASYAHIACAQPRPGEVYREYYFTNTYGDAGGAIRIGGKQGVSHPDRGSDFGYVNAWIDFPHQVELKHALRAELVVEKILSHNSTRGLAIQWNQGPWLALPEPEAIPEPRSQYYHHTCLVKPLDLANLKTEQNRFRLRVSPEHDWGWPQNLIYGVHLRVYYDQQECDAVQAHLIFPEGGSLGRTVPLGIEITHQPRRIQRVEYLGKYEGVNWEGDGAYDRWHYFYYHGQLIHNLATTTIPPYAAQWDTSWVPDQDRAIELSARITDDSGLIYQTEAIQAQLERPDLIVELCKPMEVPQNWVSRRAEYHQKCEIEGPLKDAIAARLCWSSWSPGYMNGLFINGHKVLDSEGPRYRYFDHMVDLDDVSVLAQGSNDIATGKTPLYDGKMVHGMEVNWPGIQLLIQYRR